MKRFVLGVLALALVLCLGLPCAAAENEVLSVTGGNAAAGQTLYLTVSLTQPVRANTVGITCQFDESLLAAQPALSSWGTTGLLAAFESGNMGAWAVSGETALEGKLCVLAFQVKEGVAFENTEVSCTVKFKTDAQEVGVYTVKAQVSCQCQHSYGDWKSAGGLGHERVCSLCGGKNTQSHDWDDGTERKEQDVTVITKTCLVCKEQIKTEMPSGADSEPLVQPEKGPTQEQPSQGGDTVIPEQETLPGVEVILGEDGSIINSQTGDVIVPGGADSTLTVGAAQESHDHTADTADHDHAHAPSGQDPVVLWVILGVLALAVAAGAVFLKKR